MVNLIRSELFKLRKERSFWTLVIIIALAAIAFPVALYISSLSQGKPGGSGVDFFVNAMMGNSFITSISICIFAGFFIASEYSTGVMKTIASSGNSRAKILGSKLVALMIAGSILGLLFPIITSTVASLLSGVGHLTDVATGTFILRSIGLTILYSISVSSIMALFATVFNESGKAIAFSITFFILINTVLAIMGSVFPFIEIIYNNSVFKLFDGLSKFKMEEGEWLRILLVPIITCIVFSLLSIWVYRKKEIK
ncbi:hypothetical protein Back11_60300 [Paenibacillus baekrokdamisoli]|uniref:Uncharacterized protein n=1 Tax=Paenibacillus baekrokdamisoli TaxID=1712516 RepID=A0A3G9J8L2_9BACL|nr:ABC transporter permease [Paenibacillus baekrokdamisoli]MBB3071279.1 ABC-2 type transport system permease protein [Paenibacillus baekrokdamisoli]BBH24685.1 hypothetical protein Back11_60300 [Paenibacillus baekrokdamisoli]